MSTLSDHYLEGLLQKNPKIIQSIYKDFSKRIETMVIKNNGTQDDARDVFQEALIVIWRKAGSPHFELTSSFYTYLYSVCRFVWLRKQKKKDNNLVTISEANGLKSSFDIQEELETNERHQIFRKHFATLGPDCKQILTLFWKGMQMKEIAKLMKIENDHAARNRKYRCQKKLEERIIKDPIHAELSYPS